MTMPMDEGALPETCVEMAPGGATVGSGDPVACHEAFYQAVAQREDEGRKVAMGNMGSMGEL
jgi:hypothetical protein